MRSRTTAVAGSSSSSNVLSLTRVALVITASVAAACVRTADSAPSDAATDHTPVAVVVQTLTSSTRAWSTIASGIVNANTTVDVAFQVPGKVINVGPDEGQAVRAGETIAALDPAEYRLAVEQASAQSERAANDRDRNRPLLAAGSIAPADMDHLESGARQSAAAADLAKKHLADTHLSAPLSGIIARRAIEVGATVAPGQAVYTIVALDPVRVRVGVPEGDIGRISEGLSATVRIPALDTSFAGRVTLIGVAADPTTRSYTVEITVPNPARRLRAGMVAEASIATKATTSVLMVPAAAVLQDGAAVGAPLIYVLDRDGTRAHSRRVTIGSAHGDSLEIASGLEVNDRVIVAGQQRLRDGALVRALAANEKLSAANGSARP